MLLAGCAVPALAEEQLADRRDHVAAGSLLGVVAVVVLPRRAPGGLVAVDVDPDDVVAGTALERDREADRVRPRAAEGGDVGVGEGRHGADRAGVDDVVEEDVHAVGLVLEAQVAHPGAAAVVRADRHVQAGLHGGLRRADPERRAEARLQRRLAGRLCEAGRERLVTEAFAGDGIGQAEGELAEPVRLGGRVVIVGGHLHVVGAGLRPAHLAVDVAHVVAGAARRRSDRPSRPWRTTRTPCQTRRAREPGPPKKTVRRIDAFPLFACGSRTAGRSVPAARNPLIRALPEHSRDCCLCKARPERRRARACCATRASAACSPRARPCAGGCSSASPRRTRPRG